MNRTVGELIEGQHIFVQTIIEGRYPITANVRFDPAYFSGVPHLVRGIDDISPWIIRLPKVKGHEYSRRYVCPLTDYPKLHREFGNLDYADSKQIIDFVRKYGFLGYSFQMNKVYERLKTSVAVYVESLRRWQEEILHMKHCMSLWEHAYIGSSSTTNDENWLREYVIWDAKGIDILYPGPNRLHHFRLCGPIENKSIYMQMKQGDVIEPARLYVIQRINEHLFSNMDMSLQPFIKRQDYEIIITPKNLLSTMWYLFMKEILGIHYEDKKLHYCKVCGDPILRRMGAQTCSTKCRKRKSRRMQTVPKIG